MPVNVLYPRNPHDLAHYWETDWLHELFPPASGFRHVHRTDFYENHTLIIINNPTEADFSRLLNEYQKRNLSYGLIHLSDEFFRHNRSCYDSAKVIFRNCYTPEITSDKVMFFPLGYKMGFWKDYTGPSPHELTSEKRKYDWSFTGALKSDRRDMLEQMKRLSSNNYIHFNSGWNSMDSLSTKQYRDIMLNSKMIPSGLGNMSIDCFRIYEALEAGCIPLVIQRTPKQNFHYLEKLFGGPTPIPTVVTWTDVNQYQSLLTSPQGEELRQTIYRWWLQTKDRLKATIIQRCHQAFPSATWTNGASLPNYTPPTIPMSPLSNVPKKKKPAPSPMKSTSPTPTTPLAKPINPAKTTAVTATPPMTPVTSSNSTKPVPSSVLREVKSTGNSTNSTNASKSTNSTNSTNSTAPANVRPSAPVSSPKITEKSIVNPSNVAVLNQHNQSNQSNQPNQSNQSNQPNQRKLPSISNQSSRQPSLNQPKPLLQRVKLPPTPPELNRQERPVAALPSAHSNNLGSSTDRSKYPRNSNLPYNITLAKPPARRDVVPTLPAASKNGVYQLVLH